jgi:hypothetical protein
MSAIIQLLSAHHRKNESKSIITTLANRMGQLSEAFWFTLSLCLFVIMGPFSVFAVIIGLHQLAGKSDTQKEPEPV